MKRESRKEELLKDPVNQGLSEEDFEKVLDNDEELKADYKQVDRDYEWAFVRLITVYLTFYSLFDFLSQVVYQLPYIIGGPGLENFGLRKIYQYTDDTFTYETYVKDP